MAEMVKIVVLVGLIARPAFAQQNPPGLDWRQIQTERFKVVFPAEITADAQRVANTLEHIYGPVSKTLQGPQKPIDIVLVNQVADPNGFVALAPRRSVWFSTPPQNAGLLSGDWYQLLAVHEMRHVVQFDRLRRRGLIRLAWLLSGDLGQSILSALLVPAWFWEGDAVGVETALSQTGRGRIPQFELDIRALLLAGRRYSYYKAHHRSYRDWYPGHYPLGYFLTTYVKRSYGPQMWDQVLGRTARWGFHPFSFSRALRKYTGASAAQTYERAMDELTELWQAQQKDLPTTPLRLLAGQRRSSVWTNYEYPHLLADGSVLASKSGLADPATLVRLHPDGREERVRLYQSLGGLRVAGGKVVWNRSTPDRRWVRNYSDVVVLDIASGQTRQITHAGKLFAPAPSPDGTRIAAIEFGPDRRCYLVLLETATGAEQARFPAPAGVFWRTPAWSEDGRYIAVVRQDDRGSALERIDAAAGQGQLVLPHTHADIGWPVFWGSYLLFDAPYGGIDNINAVHLPSGAQYQVSSRPLAATRAAVAGDSLLFQEYTVDGYRIAVMPLDPAAWTPIEQVADRRVRYYEPLIDQEQGGAVLADIPQRAYPVSGYRPLGHLLDVHSWSYSPAPPRYTLGLTSNDLLDLSSMSGGVEYNSNERAFSVLGDFSLAAWYPVFSVGGRWGERVETYKVENRENGLTTTASEVEDKWTEKSLRAGVELPLNFSRGPWQSFAHLSAEVEWTDIAGRDRLNRPADDLYWPDAGSAEQAVRDVFTTNHNGRFAPLTYQLSWQRSRASAARDLGPLWGQSLQLTYRHTPLAGDYDGALLAGQLGLLFPGVAAHHSLQLESGYEWQQPAGANPYRFASQQPFVRGYSYRFHRRFYQGQANYALPLFYPDWNVGALAFFQRLKVNFFYDYGRGTGGWQPPKTYQTAGAELTTDFHVFSLPIPLEMGLRYAYRFDEGDWHFSLVVGP